MNLIIKWFEEEYLLIEQMKDEKYFNQKEEIK